MKTVLAILLIYSPVFAGPKGVSRAAKGDEFKEKYLFTHLQKPAKKSVSDISKCFKFNKPSKEVLQSYQQCRKDPKLPAPLEEALGTCVRNDGANAYFFEDMQECESARAEVVDSLAD